MRRHHERESKAAWKDAVLRQYNGLCALTGRPAEDIHHIVTEQKLRRRAQEMNVDPLWLVCDVRVGMPLTRRAHERHHSWHNRIPREFLPSGVFEFVEQFGLTDWLEKNYPALEDAA